MPTNYAKTFERLDSVASKFWPLELSEIEAQLTIIPLLLESQDQFIHLISVKTSSLENFFGFIELVRLPANLILKHLVLLADFGGEMLQRVSAEFETLFPLGELHYSWSGEQRIYKFGALPNQKLGDKALKIDSKELLNAHPLDALQKDAIAILLFGSVYSNENQGVASTLAKCNIGEYLGHPYYIARKVKQRYIWDSKAL